MLVVAVVVDVARVVVGWLAFSFLLDAFGCCFSSVSIHCLFVCLRVFVGVSFVVLLISVLVVAVVFVYFVLLYFNLLFLTPVAYIKPNYLYPCCLH